MPPTASPTAQTQRTPGSLRLHPEGFHGDRHLQALVRSILPEVRGFIETGTNVGTTACWVARNAPDLPIRSCEASDEAAEHARENLSAFAQAEVRHESSPGFLEGLGKREPDLMNAPGLWWLDAHGWGFQWPLAEEVAWITKRCDSGFILIDDFKVPGRDWFKHDVYDGQVCGLEMVEPALAPELSYTLTLPTYSEHTSKHHPLIGVGLIRWGVRWALPEALADLFEDRPL
ncbi:MAG: hypothetical protein AAF995_08345 [Planctomycetota bacterium]